MTLNLNAARVTVRNTELENNKALQLQGFEGDWESLSGIESGERGIRTLGNGCPLRRFSKPVQDSDDGGSKALPRKDIGTTRALKPKATGPKLAPVAEDRSEALPVSVADLKRLVAVCRGLPEHVRTTLATILQTVEPERP